MTKDQLALPDQSLARSMLPIIEAIGWDAAISLVARFGGTTISPRASGPIASCIGTDAAQRLSSLIGPGVVYIPRCMSWALARRNEEIVARYAYGETQTELAVRFALTDRHIRSILANGSAATPPAPKGPDLFSATEGAAP